jgi:hypothetical protein
MLSRAANPFFDSFVFQLRRTNDATRCLKRGSREGLNVYDVKVGPCNNDNAAYDTTTLFTSEGFSAIYTPPDSGRK